MYELCIRREKCIKLLKRYRGLAILGISEARWSGSGKIQLVTGEILFYSLLAIVHNTRKE